MSRSSRRLLSTLVVLGMLSLAGASGASAGPGGVELHVESSVRPQYVSGGDVLVRVTAPGGVRAEELRVLVGDREVSDAFVVQPDGSALGLVTGLSEGRNTIRARVGRGHDGIRVDNHP